jgi:hypothetical protein
MAKNETSTATVIFNGEKANATLKQLDEYDRYTPVLSCLCYSGKARTD